MSRWMWVAGGLAAIAVGCKQAPEGEKPPPPEPTGDTAPPTTDSAPTGPCEELDLTVREWQADGATEPPYYKQIAADFTVKTRDGDWMFSDHYTGCDTLLFVRANPRNADGPWMWDGEDHKDLLKALPFNTHLFFVPDDGSRSGDKDQLDVVEAKMADAITSLNANKEAWWGGTDRIHYVKDGVTEIDGWVGSYLRSPGWGFGIDRFQRIRDIGSLADGERYNGSWFDSNLSHVSHEAIAFNVESDRQDALDAEQNVLVIETWNGEVVADPSWAGVRGTIEVELPDAATMAGFDALTVDMKMTCEGEGEYTFCPAWDRITDLFVCDQPTEAVNPLVAQACQPFVPEVLGVCGIDGVPGTETCRDASECTVPSDTGDTGGGAAPVVVCQGFVPAVPAETAPCPCIDVVEQSYDAARTCVDDGSGFGECDCSCDTLVSRWITTYHREGWWTNDAHHALPWFARGGSFRFEYYSVDPWEIDIDLRFHQQGLSEATDESWPLFRGGWFDPTYNDDYQPIDVAIPADASKVELAVVISGHGQANPGNCAEFCNTQHHFGVNGTENLIDFPYLDDPSLTGEYCQDDVINGTVPNQYGTWFYARSNWCPGKEVAPIYIDVTDQVTPGSTATFTYSGDRNGGTHPGGATIVMDSFVVIHR